MPRLPLLTADTAEGEAREILSSAIGHMGLFRMLAHASTCVRPAVALGVATLSQLQLGDRERELVILLAMQIEGGRYEWVQHIEIALRAGVTQAEIDAIERRELTDAVFSPADRALLAFARGVVEEVRVPGPVFEDMHTHFSDREIVETIVTLGVYMMMARVTEALNVGPEVAEGLGVIKDLAK